MGMSSKIKTARSYSVRVRTYNGPSGQGISIRGIDKFQTLCH